MTDLTKLAPNYQWYFGDIQSQPSNNVDKESLLWFAKTAARAYLNDKIPLNTSITKLASTEKDLNRDHLKRIAEMANNEVFEQLFNNSSDKNVHFDVANPDQIFSSIGTEKVAQYNQSSYKKSPSEVFRKNTVEKTAQVQDQPLVATEVFTRYHADPRKDLQDTKEKLAAAKEELETELLATSHNIKLSYDMLFNEVKREVRKSSFDKVAQAIFSVSSDYGMAREDVNVLEDLTYDLMKQKVASIKDVNVNVTKIASLSVNKEHPIAKNFLEYTKLAHYKNQIHLAIQEVDEGLAKTASAISTLQKRK